MYKFKKWENSKKWYKISNNILGFNYILDNEAIFTNII
jgi:hypothetical protein